MCTLKYCVVCLTTDVKIFSMNNSVLATYSKLLQLPLFKHEPYICYECAALLMKFDDFYVKCHRTHKILTALMSHDSEIIEEAIRKIDRNKFKLLSKLSHSDSMVQLQLSGECDNEQEILALPEIKVENQENQNKQISRSKLKEEVYQYEQISESGTNKEVYQDEQLIESETYEEVYQDEQLIESETYEEVNQDEQLIESETYEEVYQDEQLIESETYEEVYQDEQLIESETYEEVYQDEQLIESEMNEEVYQDEQISKTKEINQVEEISNGVIKNQDYDFIDTELIECTLSDSNTLVEILPQKITKDSMKIIEINSIEIEVDIKDHGTSFRKNVIPLVKRKRSPKVDNEVINCGNTSIGELSLPVTKRRKYLDEKEQKIVSDKDITMVKMTSEEAKNNVLLRKQSVNYIQGFYKCDLCCTGFNVKSSFDNHMNRHSLDRRFECDYCRLTFTKKNYLYRHIRNSHKYKYICKICKFNCYSTAHAISHSNIHKNKKQYHCEICDASFNVAHSMYVHKSRVHNKDLGEWVCDLCGSVFTSDRGIFIHKSKTHKQETNEGKGPNCEECGVQFATETAWKRHLVLSPNHEVSNGCENCGEAFPDKDALRSHINQNHVTKQLNTNIGKRIVPRYPRKPLLFICDVCGKSYKEKKYFLDHKREHEGIRRHQCVECGKAFAHLSALSIHKTAHHKALKFQCDICQKRFGNKYPLRKHIQVHLGMCPYKCHLCDKSFIQPYLLRTHVKHTHNNVPWPAKKKKTEPKRNSEPKRNPEPKRKPEPKKKPKLKRKPEPKRKPKPNRKPRKSVVL